MEKEAFATLESLVGLAEVSRYMFHFADSMALKCAVELRIADIIHSHGCPITLAQIASSIDSPSPDTNCLMRIMRLLVHRKIFTVIRTDDGGEDQTLYGPTPSSSWILRDSEFSVAPLLLMENDERAVAPWHHLSSCVRDGGIAFEKAHGCDIWEYGSRNPDFAKVFNDGMKCLTMITLKSVIVAYEDGFNCIQSVVDVGGGTGAAITSIVSAYPHIKGINFDQPHVVATALEYPGVSNVGGDMFKTIPHADAVFIKMILHDWNDEDCVKILKNCRNAIPIKTGKVIIVEIILNPEGDDLIDDIRLISDITMIAHTSGKERTESEWKNILNAAGFPRYNIIKLLATTSIIEAFPE